MSGYRRQMLPHEGVRLWADRDHARLLDALGLVGHDRRCAKGLPGEPCRCSCAGALHGSGVVAVERAAASGAGGRLG